MLGRIFLSASLSILISAPSFAAVDPNVSTPEIQTVVTKCQLVASTANQSPNANAGQCVGSTQTFLDNLKAGTQAADQKDQQITNLVLALVPLAQAEKKCDALDDEIARAILLASQYSSTPQQQTQLQGISQTVAKCQFDATGALPSALPASPTAPAG